MVKAAARSSWNGAVLDRVRRPASIPGWAGQGCPLMRTVVEKHCHNMARITVTRESFQEELSSVL